jgi:hypothetical protein
MREIRCPQQIKINNEFRTCNKRLMSYDWEQKKTSGLNEIMTKCPKCKTELKIIFGAGGISITKAENCDLL